MQAALPLNILQRLKQTTADLHQRVEQRVHVFSTHFDMGQYVMLLRRTYGFWAPLEAQLQRLPELYHPALALDCRLKAHLLEADLRTFGVPSADVTLCTDLPQVGTIGQGLGCMYVLEGSTLGSQIIARHLTKRFGIDSDSGAAFFNAYRGLTNTRWAEFREFMMSHTDPSSADEVIGSAVESFECFDRWLAAVCD